MIQLKLLPILTLAIASVHAYVVNNGSTCYLYPESRIYGQPVDDVPSILQAFELCGNNGSVVFSKDTFTINQVMNTTFLQNCNVMLQGSVLRWSTNIPYWLSHSLYVVLQEQRTAWLFGGKNVNLMFNNGAYFDGQGQAWYTQNKNNSNEPGRPITITFYNSSNVYVENLNISQPQFWATFVTGSQNVTFNNFYVNATSNDQWGTVNTDGSDTWNSNDITFKNGIVTNGDDCIAAKGNTTNLLVSNFTCHSSNGMTIGSVGQYPLTPDYVENVTFENIRLINSIDGAYIKTWQGQSTSTDLNGDTGGGGSGYVRNVTFKNFELVNVGLPAQISQCIYNTDSNSSICDTSKMQVSNITWQNFTGTSTYNIAASIACVSLHPCPNIYFHNFNVSSVNNTLGLPLFNTSIQHEVFQCANVVNENTTSGIGCNHWAPNNYGQEVTGNIQ